MTGRKPAPSPFLAQSTPWFETAFSTGLPAFQPDVQGSNPLNSTPYLLSLARFRALYGQGPDRAAKFDALAEVLQALDRGSAEVVALLVGGSVLEPSRVPKDLDCLVYYRAKAQVAPDLGKLLSRISTVARTNGIDARFAPLDGDPLVAIKLTAYFTSLYGMTRAGDHKVTGHLLVVPD